MDWTKNDLAAVCCNTFDDSRGNNFNEAIIFELFFLRIKKCETLAYSSSLLTPKISKIQKYLKI